MEQFEGTPGPWFIDVNGVDARWNIDDKEGNSVALTQQLPNDKDWKKRDANTRLIVTAPELLQALQRMYRAGQKQNWNEHYESEMKTARVVIAKALGKELE